MLASNSLKGSAKERGVPASLFVGNMPSFGAYQGFAQSLWPRLCPDSVRFHDNGRNARLFLVKRAFLPLSATRNLLKLAGVAGSAGHGKHMVEVGEVKVDGQPESRKTAKIRAGQYVECLGTRITVVGTP